MAKDKGKLIKGITVTGFLIGGVVLGVWFMSSLQVEKSVPKKVVQNITMIKPPPPPPPPPKVEEPPPPEVEEEVDIPEPEQVAEEMPDSPSDEPPAGDSLGVDADGGAGGDSFGLVGRKGGRSLLGGSGAGSNGWYTKAVHREIVDWLNEFRDIRKKKYSVKIKLYIDSDGALRRVALLESTGDIELDQAIKDALGKLQNVGEKPPSGNPVALTTIVKSHSLSSS